jgi:hypothetical protein
MGGLPRTSGVSIICPQDCEIVGVLPKMTQTAIAPSDTPSK